MITYDITNVFFLSKSVRLVCIRFASIIFPDVCGFEKHFVFVFPITTAHPKRMGCRIAYFTVTLIFL